MECISENTAIRFIEGLLTESRRIQVENHLSQCEECRLLMADASESHEANEPSLSPTFQWDAKDENARSEESRIARLGTIINDTYRIERYLGQGGMGRVFEASHLRLPRRFALKFLHSPLASNPEAVARIKREADLTSRLSHPNIVQVIDFNFTPDGTPFIVMEFLKGTSLSIYLAAKDTLCDLGFIVRILYQTASALSAAHEKGVIHRDLKPSNLFLCKNTTDALVIKVMDFGISKMLGTSEELTNGIVLLGTPRYMSPEQASGYSKEIDQRTDIFSLGVILYELIAGTPPFDGQSIPETLYKLSHGKPAVTQAWRRTPNKVKRVILRAMEKDPESRQYSMDELWDEFSKAAGLPKIPLGTDLNLVLDGLQTSLVGTKRFFYTFKIAAMLLGFAFLAFGLLRWLVFPPSQGMKNPSKIAKKSNATNSQIKVEPLASDVHHLQKHREISQKRAPHNVDKKTAAAAQSPRVRAYPPKISPLRLKAKRKRILKENNSRPIRGFGKLIVQSTDHLEGEYLWADVLLDGKNVGRTALTLEKIPTGWHEIEVQREGYATRSKRFYLKPKAQQKLVFKLIPVEK